MDLEYKITELLKRYRKGLDYHQIIEQLKLEDHDFTSFCNTLNKLVNEYQIFTDENNHYGCKEAFGYEKGVLKINPKGFGFVEWEEGSVYIALDMLKNALPEDEVLVKVHEKYDGAKEGEILQIIAHHIQHVVGTVKVKENKKFFLPDGFLNNRRFNITNIDDFKLVDNTKVLLKIDRYDKLIAADIEKIIGFKYDPGVDILSLLYEYGIDPQFPKDVMREVTKISDYVREEDKENRRDLTDMTIITIDGADSRDLDDAVSVIKTADGYRLGVHIADVSYYVKEGSPINAEAYARGTSVYVVDRVVPMLPQALSNGICSLNPHVERLTISCVMDIDDHGEIVKYEIFPSFIKTTERMTYTKVNEILAHDAKACKEYAHITQLCEDMKQLARILRQRRKALGAIDFDTKEAKIIVDEKGNPIDIKLRERHEAERIIEDFMIAANECVAAHLKWMELPGMYRIHETPEPKKMREFARISMMLGYPLKADVNHVYPKQLQQHLSSIKDEEIYPILSTMLLRSMQKARYDRQCLGHFGLGLTEYLHFTSPIRRYPDLVVHRMLRKYYFNTCDEPHKMQADEHWMEQAAKQCSAQERNAVDAERAVDDMKKAQYMEAFVGDIFEGVISTITKFGFFVELENTVEGLVHISTLKDDFYHFDERAYALVGEHNRKAYRMGQKVRVRCTDASRFKKQVDFEVIPIKQKLPKRAVTKYAKEPHSKEHHTNGLRSKAQRNKSQRRRSEGNFKNRKRG